MNRKQILSSATIAVFAGILLTWAPSTAYAGNNAAIVIHSPDSCGYIDENGNPIFFEGRVLFVANKNHGMIVCQLKDVANTTGQAIHWQGTCFIGDFAAGIAIDGTFKETISQHDNGVTGDMTLKCTGDVVFL